MLRQMISRGPDDCAESEVTVRSGGRLLLGARRLAILDLTYAGRQPMRDPVTGNQVVLNGEIYNFRQLRRELECGGYQFRSSGDTEVVLAGFGLWGEAVVERLRGMFACALWNEAKQSLTLVRDRLGIKPLYYAEASGDFVFASQLRALAASGLVPRELDAAGLDSLLQFGSVQEPATLLRGVRLLPAGHCLRWQPGAGEVTLHRYWSLPAGQPFANGNGHTRERMVSDLRQRLGEAVKLHMASDVPVGSFLSGGMDSAAVTTLAAQAAGSPISTFCVSFPEREFDEGAAAQRAAKHIGCAHHEARLEHSDVCTALPQAIAALDQPTVDGVNTWFIARAAHHAGIKVALSGIGGDELFAGYDSFRRVPRLEQASQLPRWSRALTGATMDSRFFPARAKRVAAWLREEDGFGHPYFATRMMFAPAQAARLLQPEWLLAPDFDVFEKSMAEYQRLLASPDPVNRVSALEISLYLRNTVLRDTDCASMAHSVEVRVPLLDHVLVEQVLGMPGHWKMNGGSTKPLLAAAMAPLLPAETLRHPKRGFDLPWDAWLRGPLHAEADRFLAEPGPVLEPVLHWRVVRNLWTGFLSRKVHWSRPWLFFVLKKWCELHL